MLNTYCTWKTAKVPQSHILLMIKLHLYWAPALQTANKLELWGGCVYVQRQKKAKWFFYCSFDAFLHWLNLKGLMGSERRRFQRTKHNHKCKWWRWRQLNVNVSVSVVGWRRVKVCCRWGGRWQNHCFLIFPLLISRHQDSLCISYQSSRQSTASPVILYMDLCPT